jgi:5-methylcytosine-specific restriction endonuclease McrA
MKDKNGKWIDYHTRQNVIERNERIKARLLVSLGTFCVFCGETDPVVLEVDHIIPHPRVQGLRKGFPVLLAQLRREDESPFNLQVICANCHARKTKMERVAGYGFPARQSRGASE